MHFISRYHHIVRFWYRYTPRKIVCSGYGLLWCIISHPLCENPAKVIFLFLQKIILYMVKNILCKFNLYIFNINRVWSKCEILMKRMAEIKLWCFELDFKTLAWISQRGSHIVWCCSVLWVSGLQLNLIKPLRCERCWASLHHTSTGFSFWKLKLKGASISQSIWQPTLMYAGDQRLLIDRSVEV